MPGLLAGLDALIVALGLLAALLVVSAVLRPLLVAVLKDAPFIGGWLASNVDSGLASFSAAILAPANASMGIISSSLDWVADHGRQLFSSLTGLGNAVFWSIWTLGTVTLPDAVGKSLRQAEGLFDEARAYAWGLVQGAVRTARDLFVQAEQDAGDLVALARKDAADAVNTAEQIARDDLHRVEKTGAQLWQQAEYDAGQLVAASEVKLGDLVALARKDFGDAVGAVERDLGQLGKAVGVAVADTASILGGDIAAAEARLQETLAGVESGLGATIDQVIKSGPWGAAVAAYEGGEAALAADVETLVRLSLAEIRQQAAQVEVLRAKYGPQIRAALSEIGKTA